MTERMLILGRHDLAGVRLTTNGKTVHCCFDDDPADAFVLWLDDEIYGLATNYEAALCMGEMFARQLECQLVDVVVQMTPPERRAQWPS